MAIFSASMIGMTQPEEPKRWASRVTAAGYLDVHPSSVDRLAIAGIITRHKVGYFTRYDLDEIDRVAKAGAVERAGVR